MRRHTANIVLLALLLLLAGLTWGLRRDPAQPGYQFIPEMHYSIPYDSQSENPNFADGKTLRTPVEGTIPRGMLPLHFEKSEADAKRAGGELRNPFIRDSAQVAERGGRLFAIYCQPCHGATGLGDGVVTKYGFPPPPSFDSPALRGQKDGQMFHTITYGKGNMPSLASQVARDDRWMIVLRVRALQELALKQSQKAAIE